MKNMRKYKKIADEKDFYIYSMQKINLKNKFVDANYLISGIISIEKWNVWSVQYHVSITAITILSHNWLYRMCQRGLISR